VPAAAGPLVEEWPVATETYLGGTDPRITDAKRVKWAKWALKKGGTVKPTNTIRQIQAKVLLAS
jgi:hypothetical protein